MHFIEEYRLRFAKELFAYFGGAAYEFTAGQIYKHMILTIEMSKKTRNAFNPQAENVRSKRMRLIGSEKAKG